MWEIFLTGQSGRERRTRTHLQPSHCVSRESHDHCEGQTNPQRTAVLMEFPCQELPFLCTLGPGQGTELIPQERKWALPWGPMRINIWVCHWCTSEETSEERLGNLIPGGAPGKAGTRLSTYTCACLGNHSYSTSGPFLHSVYFWANPFPKLHIPHEQNPPTWIKLPYSEKHPVKSYFLGVRDLTNRKSRKLWTLWNPHKCTFCWRVSIAYIRFSKVFMVPKKF